MLRHLARSMAVIGELEAAVDVQRTIVTLPSRRRRQPLQATREAREVLPLDNPELSMFL